MRYRYLLPLHKEKRISGVVQIYSTVGVRVPIERRSTLLKICATSFLPSKSMRWRFLMSRRSRPVLYISWDQCCGSMTFWGGSGSGSADPCLWQLDPDPGSGSCYFRHCPSRWQQKTNFLSQFFLLITFWRYIYIIFKDKKSKRVTK